MIADLVSADFGWLRLLDGKQSAQRIMKPGKNRDGYFSSDNIQEQVGEAMHILWDFFPEYKHILIYDNATTHLKQAEDALSACHMPKNIPKPGHNWGIKVSQRDAETGEKINKPDGSPVPRAQTCCCRCILFNQSDFAGVEPVLETTCCAQGFQVIFLLKFHCELNFIEQCWGYAKRVYHLNPPSSREDQLEKNAVAVVEAVLLILMWKFAVWSRWFMDAYERGLNSRQVAWAAWKYKGHHILPAEIMTELGKKGIV